MPAGFEMKLEALEAFWILAGSTSLFVKELM
jgi:hypothetical protein